jgi:transcriptional regulator with XRE-family HTH domain
MKKMELLSERLKWAIAQKVERDPHHSKITQADVARIADRSRTSVTFWYKDQNGMDAEAARPLADFLGVDAVWLETGEGEPFNGDQSSSPKSQTGELARSMRLEAESAKELRLLTVYRLANAIERETIDSAVALVEAAIDARNPNNIFRRS